MPKYSYEELIGDVENLPNGVDPAAREVSFSMYNVGSLLYYYHSWSNFMEFKSKYLTVKLSVLLFPVVI